jgi:hypothetical protein
LQRVMLGLLLTGDRLASGRAGPTSTGTVSGCGRACVLQPDPMTTQRLRPCPSTLPHDLSQVVQS